MSTKPHTAVIIVDMLNDFVTGSLKCERAQRIIPRIAALIDAARKKDGVYVFYANDSHIKGIDKELELWGDHAIRGTPGADVIPELEPKEGDYVVPKRRYSGFFQTDLQLYLEELGVGTTIICGLHAHMCVRHTSADAYQWGYKVVIPDDGVESFTEEDYQGGLAYLKGTYGAEITNVEAIISKWQ